MASKDEKVGRLLRRVEREQGKRIEEMVRQHLPERLRREMEKHAHGAGRVIHVEAYEPAKGGGWVVVFDTEYAALKVHYKYLGSPGLKLGKSPAYGGWYVSTTGSR